MGKARVGIRIKDAMTSGKSHNRSADLDQLMQRFTFQKKKIDMLIAVLKKHHAVMLAMNESRIKLADSIISFTEGTPLHPSGGSLNGESSYAAIHKKLNTKVAGYADKYNQFVIDYVVEWNRVITTRVTNGAKTTETLRRDLDHYQKKVESLRTGANQMLAKGKSVDAKTQDKVNRNEEKYVKAKATYDRTANDMCMLLEEVTERAWKDVHVVLVKMAQFDSTMANEEAKGLGAMDQVIASLKRLAGEHDLKAPGRLKELEQQEPSLLYTGTKGGTVGAMITSGDDDGGSGAFGVPMGTAMPPGAIAPQGMGGFPVPVATSELSGYLDNSNHSTRSSFTSTGPAPTPSYQPTTSDMLAISASAAPPPTLEEVNNATQTLSLGNGGRPNHLVSYSRRGSTISDDGSVPMAPPPMAAPPPPPGARPPVTRQQSGYQYHQPMATAVVLSPANQVAPSWGAPAPLAPSPMSAHQGAVGYGSGSTNPFDPPGRNTNPFGNDPPAQHNTNPFNY